MVFDTQGFDAEAFLKGRGAVEVADGTVTVGTESARYTTGDVTALLTTYLVLVRKLRKQRREAVVVLRADDVRALAAATGEPPHSVIERLGALMGATRAQRTAMATLFATGALVLGLASSAAAVGVGRSASSSGAPSARPATAVSVSTGPGSAVRDSPIYFVDHVAGPASSIVITSGSSNGTPAGAVADGPDTAWPAETPTPTVATATDASGSSGGSGATAPTHGATVTTTASAADAAPTEPEVATTIVDIGTPPIPDPTAVYPGITSTPASDSSVSGSPTATIPEVIETPWLVADPPAPG